jgi:hypothetical protein
VYDGEWHEDAIQGFGKFTYASGACYEVRKDDLPSVSAVSSAGLFL